MIIFIIYQSIIFLVYLFIYHVVTTQLKTQWHSFSNNIKVANPHMAWKWLKWLIDNQKRSKIRRLGGASGPKWSEISLNCHMCC